MSSVSGLTNNQTHALWQWLRRTRTSIVAAPHLLLLRQPPVTAGQLVGAHARARRRVRTGRHVARAQVEHLCRRLVQEDHASLTGHRKLPRGGPAVVYKHAGGADERAAAADGGGGAGGRAARRVVAPGGGFKGGGGGGRDARAAAGRGGRCKASNEAACTRGKSSRRELVRVSRIHA